MSEAQVQGFTFAQARAMSDATTLSTYRDDEREYLAVMTRCGTIEETHAGWFMDTDWIEWVRGTFPGWDWVEGTGDHDSGGPWFAQEHRRDEEFIWLALGVRARAIQAEESDDPFYALTLALSEVGVMSQVVDTGGQTMRLFPVLDPLLVAAGIEVFFSDEHTDLLVIRGDDFAQIDSPDGVELPNGWRQDAVTTRIAQWYASLTVADILKAAPSVGVIPAKGE